MASTLHFQVRAAAPLLTASIDGLCRQWLSPLIDRLGSTEFRPKQINDVIWGTVELLPWEVALLDAPLLQRMRGVRQLGLAHLVFPGAVQDRLEHIIGVVGAVEAMVNTLDRQIDRWNRDSRNKNRHLPPIKTGDRHRLRLAALFHDLGHGPFSHAIEPVLEVVSPLGDQPSADGGGWRAEISIVRDLLKTIYGLNDSPSVSELMAVMIILSEAVGDVLASDHLITERQGTGPVLQEQLVACVIGALDGPGADHLSAIISSQLDADRMDYLSRDAHHSGLSIGFDTDRLLSRLELLQMRDDNTPGKDDATRKRIAKSAPDPVLQIGIAASGFGSVEQMLIGRTFLYDRLYHHHKVRAAEAMAQRMMLIAERDRKRRLSLDEIFLSVGDDTLVRIFAEEVRHDRLETQSPAAARLAKELLDRRLLHRAYAFRARFVAMPEGMGTSSLEATRNEKWRRLLKAIETLADRYELGVAIFDVAMQAAGVLESADIDRATMAKFKERLTDLGPEHIIIDVPQRKADAIRTMARYPDGTLKVPEFSFNPVKWADAYDLQKRTGYVFCPRDVVPIVALAASIVFMVRFGVVMSTDADGYIKTDQLIDAKWLPGLIESELVDQDVVDQLQRNRYSLLSIQQEDLCVPPEWIVEKTHFASSIAAPLKNGLKAGVTAGALGSFSKVMAGMFAFLDLWYNGSGVTSDLADEAALQEKLLDHLRSRGLKVVEGSVVGGGKLDLFVEDTVLIENKFGGIATDSPTKAAPAAGVQGRRYAIALMSQIVISVAAVRIKKGTPVPQRTDMVEVKPLVDGENRTDIRFTVPFGATVPSRDK